MPRSNYLKICLNDSGKVISNLLKKNICCTIGNKSNLGANFFPSNSKIAHTQEASYNQHNLN